MKHILFICITLFIASCAGVKKTGESESSIANEKTSEFDESFDPLSLDDDDIIISEKKKETVDSKKNLVVEKPPNVDKIVEKKEVDGWRVQILATGNIESATLTHQEALDQFDLSEINAYLIFEAPLYKVRIGDATDQNSAQIIRDLARDYGYVGAFIVRSKVIVQTGSNQTVQ